LQIQVVLTRAPLEAAEASDAEADISQAGGAVETTIVQGLLLDLDVIAQASDRLTVRRHVQLQNPAMLGFRGEARPLP
jgi:hypothetical protein